MPKSLKKAEVKRWNYFAMAKLYLEMQDTRKKLNRMIARSKRKLREKRLRKRRSAIMKTLQKKKVMGVPRNKPKQGGGVELEVSSQWFVRARVEEPINQSKKMEALSSSSSSTSSSSSSSSDSSPSRRPPPGHVSTISYLQLSSGTEEDGEE